MYQDIGLSALLLRYEIQVPRDQQTDGPVNLNLRIEFWYHGMTIILSRLTYSTPSYHQAMKIDTGFDHLPSSHWSNIFRFPSYDSALYPDAVSSNKRWLEKNVPSWHQVQNLINLSQEPIRQGSHLPNIIISIGRDSKTYHLSLLLSYFFEKMIRWSFISDPF